MTPEEVSLRDYMELCMKGLDDKIDAQTRLMTQHFQLNEQAIKKAEDSMTLRLESMNQFRAQLTEERSSLATKEWSQDNMKILSGRLDKLENISSFSAGKMWMVMAIFAAIPTILAVIALFNR
jgi:hypothetical protein